MSKKKNKNKRTKRALPKKIGGIKIPKSIRKGDVGAFLGSPAGKTLLAETVLLAGAAFAGRESDSDSSIGRAIRHPLRSARKAAEDVADAAGTSEDASGRLAFAFQEASRAFREALAPEGRPLGAGWEMGDQPVGGKKKRSIPVPEDEASPLAH